MDTSMLAFATDLNDEGIDAVLDNVQERAGLGGLTLAASYHDARDLFPHNPVRKVRYLEGGAVFFRLDESRYEGLRPHVAGLASTKDPLEDLCVAAVERGMEANAWVVFLHSDRLGFTNPGCATRNAFGDPYLTDLCPSNPEVRGYARALASDVARYDVSTVFAESLHFHGLEHGYHHERYFEEIGPVGSYLLGLCFCDHCLEAATRSGVDAERVHRSVRDELERRFSGENEGQEEVSREVLADFGEGQLLLYIDARIGTVTSLAAEVSGAVAEEGARFVFLDLSGAEKGFATGHPTGEATPTIGWRTGVDAAALAEACDNVEVTGYAADADRLRFDLDAYSSLLADGAPPGLLLRPMPPDCRSAENLAEKVAIAREYGLERLDFYHYGFCRLRSLDWIRESLIT